MVEAVVQFDYTAQEPDELSLQKGDIITEIIIQPGGWWEGKLKGKVGMFPDNFVKVVGEGDGSGSGSVTHRTTGGRKCKVLFSYHPVNDDELPLQVNDIVDILDEVEEGWWKGRLRNQIGVFPSNFVVELTDENLQEPPPSLSGQTDTSSLKKPKSNHEEHSKVSDSTSNHHEDGAQSSSLPSSLSTDSDVPVLPPKPVKEICKALYPYKALNDDELTLREGDVITIISRDGQDKGWWKGELNGQIGVFPDNFVQVIPIDEASKPLRPPTKTTIVSSNRVKDLVTKPNLNPGTGSPPPNVAAPAIQKKTLETPPKTDEKTSPPGISKKPVLPPPPLKKPQRSPTGSTKQPISSPTPSESSTNKLDNFTPASVARSPSSIKHSVVPQDTNLSHPGKPSHGSKKGEVPDNTDGSGFSVLSISGSYLINRHENSVNTYDNNEKGEIDLDCVGRTAMLTHPTASRVRAPRRRPPSSIYTKEDGINSVGMMNGNVDTHDEPKGQGGATKTWLEELKMNQSMKQFSQGRTRVMIGSGAGGECTSPEPPAVKPTPPGVVFRNSTSSYGQRPQSMYSSEKTSPNTRPFSAVVTTSDNIKTDPNVIKITVKDWADLNSKVTKLEETVKSQQETFTKTIQVLTNRLNDESERVRQMQLEIEKLTDLVTQV